MAVTTRSDLSADMVVQRCHDRGVSVYRFNTEDYPATVGVEINPAAPHAARLLPSGTEAVLVGRAKGIWIRRPQWPVIAADVDDEGDRRLALQEAVAAMGGLWRLLNARCVSDPDALQHARWKIPQLQLAAALGFSVPETIVTTDHNVARAFLDEGVTVLKAVQELSVTVDGGVRAGYVQQASVVDLDGIAIAPLLLQRRIGKIADWRVTVVGETVYAARTATVRRAPVDVREAEGVSTVYEPRDLPERTAQACVAFLHAAGLRFGAFDLVEDPSGRVWFLECNANGQWGWIEDATALPITDAIISELVRSSDAGRG